MNLSQAAVNAATYPPAQEVDVPLQSFSISRHPELFPVDYYYGTLTWQAQLPQTLCQPPCNLFTGYGFGTTYKNKQLTYTQPNPLAGTVYVKIQRTPFTQALFSFAMASIPFIFGGIFIHTLFFDAATKKAPLQDFMADLAAAVLAILPLHDVLVPKSIDQLTLLDIWLGASAAFLVSIALVRYFRDMRRQSGKPTT